MINEERVKELYQVAIYDQRDEDTQEQVKSYFKSDYIGKEIIKSFFSGTFAFIFIGVLYGLYKSEAILADINTMDYAQVGASVVVLYIVFMMIYLFITLLVYTIRYNVAFKKLNKYGEHLKKLNKIYEREDKLK